MSAANNIEADQKIQPLPKTDPTLAEKEKEELMKELNLLEWPPKDFKDEFTRPKFFVCMLRNKLQEGVCVVNSAPTVEDAKNPDKEPVKEIAVFFCHCADVKVPEQANEEETKKFMIYPMPDNRGDCKSALLHAKTKEYIEQVCCRYGNVVLKFHTVPHPTQHGVFTVSELYLVQAGSEAELLNVPASQRCFTCKRASAIGFCKCERRNFCSKVCRGRAVEDGLHTEAECKKLMRTKVFDTRKDILKMLADFQKEAAERDSRKARLEAAKKETEEKK